MIAYYAECLRGHVKNPSGNRRSGAAIRHNRPFGIMRKSQPSRRGEDLRPAPVAGPSREDRRMAQPPGSYPRRPQGPAAYRHARTAAAPLPSREYGMRSPRSLRSKAPSSVVARREYRPVARATRLLSAPAPRARRIPPRSHCRRAASLSGIERIGVLLGRANKPSPHRELTRVAAALEQLVAARKPRTRSTHRKPCGGDLSRAPVGRHA